MGVKPASCALLSAYARSHIRIKAKQICSKPGFSRSDEEDLMQDLTMHLLQKAGQYDPSRGASADTFANRVIESQAKMILRARRRLKRGGGLKVQSLNEEQVSHSRRPMSLAHVVDGADRHRRLGGDAPDPISSFDSAEAVARVLKALPADVRPIAHRLQHTTVAAIAKETGVSRRRVYDAVAQIRRQCEAFGLGNA